ncbi:hypothetical protein [Stappia sp.]|uniref:hypothetical protein n=1 Tax=Stappia sp. TaxID=1870903 RepID=UPI003C7CAA41
MTTLAGEAWTADEMTARLQRAEAAGIVSADQVQRMQELWRSEEEARTGVSVADAEEVRFARGFHDVFLSIGIVMLLVGAAYGLGAFLPDAGVAGLLAAVIWMLSEIFARRMRLALPSFLLAVVFAPVFLLAGLLAMASGPLFSGSQELLATNAGSAILPALIGVCGAGLHYWRFGVPVGAAGIAGSLLFLVAVLLETAVPGFLEAHLAWFTLAAGGATFIAAMWFDSRDVARVTTASDKAFWLHLLAAPLLVHSILMLATADANPQGAGDALAVIGLFVVLALVAVLVDRRAMLVSGLGYFGVAIAQLLGSVDPSGEVTLAATLVVLGCFILLLGSGWRRVRRVVASPFRSMTALRYLPAVD